MTIPMKQLLVYHGKDSCLYYDISTPEMESASYLALFNYLDKDLDCYTPDTLEDPQPMLLEKARQGDWQAAKRLLQIRRNYEYEGISTERVQQVALPQA